MKTMRNLKMMKRSLNKTKMMMNLRMKMMIHKHTDNLQPVASLDMLMDIMVTVLSVIHHPNTITYDNHNNLATLVHKTPLVSTVVLDRLRKDHAIY